MGTRVSTPGQPQSAVHYGGTNEVTRVDRNARNGASANDPPIETSEDAETPEERADTEPPPTAADADSPPTAAEEAPPADAEAQLAAAT